MAAYLMTTLTILVASAAFVVWMVLDGIFTIYLARFAGSDASLLSLPILLMLLVGAITVKSSSRALFPIQFPRTWTLLLPMPFVVFNLFQIDPSQLARGLPLLMIVLTTVAVGINEELFFRGFAFLGDCKKTPQYTVMLTSLVFCFLHFDSILPGQDSSLFVMLKIVFTFTIGLGFGVIRFATGSIAWGVAGHFLINLSGKLGPNRLVCDPNLYFMICQIFLAINLVAALALFLRHPAMKPRIVRCS